MDSDVNKPKKEGTKDKKVYQSPRILVHKEIDGIASYCDSAHGSTDPCRAASTPSICYDTAS